MDKREHQLQSLGICHCLYNLMKSLATYALKIMSSSHHHGSARHEPTSSKTTRVVHPVAPGTPLHEAAELGARAKFESEQANNASCEQDKCVADSSSSGPPHIEEKRRLLEQEASFSADSSQARAPKKMVSINDNVETIKLSNKKRSRKKEPEVDDDEPRPLKPILKVSSDLNNGS
ncbi:hypothetical protein ACOSQ3_015143 [Xanthoceras sorbifolium]